MSTRALYTFYPGEDGWPEQPIHVYKHHDGYPTGAADAIVAALEFAWPLPRYEHDEFAASFVAANKSHWINRELELLRELEVATAEGKFGEAATAREELERVRKYAKNGNGGGVRLCATGEFEDIAPQDLEFWYTISPKKVTTKKTMFVNQQLIVTCYAVSYDSRWTIKKLFTAPLKGGDTLKAKAKAYEDKQ